MNSLVDSGDGGPCGVVVGNLDNCSFNELVSDVPGWVGEVTDSGELDSEVLTDIDADIAGSVV